MAKYLRITVAALALLTACRTARPPSAEPIPPLTSASPAEAAQQLAARRSQFRGERSLVRVRMPMGNTTHSARGQLQVDDKLRMLLTIYTPIGTTAARLYAAGDEVVFVNDIDSTAWRGKASDLAGIFGTFTSPSAALLLAGLPPADAAGVIYSATGLQEVRYADAVVSYEPPVYPPKRVIIERRGRRLEVEHLETYSVSESLVPPAIPKDYRCCVLPQL